MHGIFSTLTANQNQDQYGIFSRINSANNTGNKYGVYVDFPSAGSLGNKWAAYFRGKTEVSGDLVIGKVNEGKMFMFPFKDSQDNKFKFCMVPNKTDNLEDYDWSVAMYFHRTGELIKRINDPNKKAFAIERDLKDVFRVMGDGKVYATEINVRLASEFPDYVFEDSYKLLSLKSLETYIQENKKLPNMPSAKEVGNKGMNVGQINTLLVEKVEELTLYTIQQQKLIEQLIKEVEELKKK